jgi:hypothetical protein
MKFTVALPFVRKGSTESNNWKAKATGNATLDWQLFRRQKKLVETVKL